MEKSGTEPSAKLSGNSYSSPTPPTKKRTAKKSSVSSRPAKLSQKNVVRIKGIPKITAEMRRELEALDNLPDDKIDFSDIPKMTEEDFNRPHWIGLHYYPGKKSVTIRLDTDIVKWFKGQGKGWQTKMNWVLRLYFASHRKTGVKVGRP
jgi:uncharacterized protein (DUF4415 family)